MKKLVVLMFVLIFGVVMFRPFPLQAQSACQPPQDTVCGSCGGCLKPGELPPSLASCWDKKACQEVGHETCSCKNGSCVVGNRCAGQAAESDCYFSNARISGGSVRYDLNITAGNLVTYTASGGCGPATAGSGDKTPYCVAGIGLSGTCGGHAPITGGGTCTVFARINTNTTCQLDFPLNSTSTITPPPQPITCNYVDTIPTGVGPVVQAGQQITVKNSASGGGGGNWNSVWSSATTGGSGVGSFSPANPDRYNTRLWTVPNNPSPGQKWTVSSIVSRNGFTSTNACQIEFRFPGFPPPEPVDSYFQTTGGNVIAQGSVSDMSLPDNEAVSLHSNPEKDAGIIVGDSIQISASGLFSEAGNSPGWNLRSYGFSGRVPTYDDYLNIVLRNAGYANLADLGCAPGLKPTSLNQKYKFWCYQGTPALNAAMDDILSDTDIDDQVDVLIPIGKNSVKLTKKYQIKNPFGPIKPIILFVNSASDSKALTVEEDLVVDPTKELSGFMAIVRGGVRVDPSVGRLDGLYLFEDEFNSGSSDKVISGWGSLLGTGGQGLSDSLGRKSDTSPAEDWKFDGKYLDLFKNVLARPSFFWQELSPQ